MAYTTDDLTALQTAIATGARRVTYNGQTVEYRDLDEMRKIERDMMAALGQTKTARRSRVVFDRG